MYTVIRKQEHGLLQLLLLDPGTAYQRLRTLLHLLRFLLLSDINVKKLQFNHVLTATHID